MPPCGSGTAQLSREHVCEVGKALTRPREVLCTQALGLSSVLGSEPWAATARRRGSCSPPKAEACHRPPGQAEDLVFGLNKCARSCHFPLQQQHTALEELMGITGFMFPKDGAREGATEGH